MMRAVGKMGVRKAALSGGTSFGVSHGTLSRAAAIGASMPVGLVAQTRSAAMGNPGSGRPQRAQEEYPEEMPGAFQTKPELVDDYIRPEKTYFEMLEDVWDSLVSFMSPVDKQIDWMRALADYGVAWGFIFMGWGAIVRLCSLGPMLYSHRNTLRMARIQNQTAELTNSMKRVKADKSLTTPERKIMTDGIKRKEKALYSKHGASKYGSFMVGLSSPLMVTAFMAIRRLAAYEDDLESAQFLWIQDLTMPDPTMALPIICTGLFVTNFELNQRLNRGGRSAVGLYMRWGIRCGALVGAYFISSQPACLFAYWVGMSTMGLMQPILLRNQAFRDYFNFPPPPKTAKQHEERSAVSWFKESVLKIKTEKIVEKVHEKPAFETINEHELILDDDENDNTQKKPKSGVTATAGTGGGRTGTA